MSVWEEVVSDGPVSEKFCNERTEAIANKIDGLGEKLTVMLDGFNHRIAAVEEICKDVLPLKQRVDNGVLGRDFTNKRTLVIVSLVVGIFTILGHLDKVVALFK